MPRDLDAFRKFYFGLALICISIPCHSDAPIFDVARFSSDPKSIVPQFQPAADHRVTRFTALQPDDLEQLNELISFIEQLAAYQ